MPPKCFRIAVVLLLCASAAAVLAQSPTEAPAGFDNVTNGFVDQATYDADRLLFERRFGLAQGLGPVYNARACGECHNHPIAGGASQVSNLRAGRFNGSAFIAHPGGSLIGDRATDPAFQEHVLDGNNARSFRIASSLAGAGFIESIANTTLVAISNAQPAAVRGQVIQVPVLEADNALRVGRFGWKNQFASLLSATASELLNQVGITSSLQPFENTSNGRRVDDGVLDPEDTSDAVSAFTRFLRATKAPPVDSDRFGSPDGNAGSSVFNAIGCAACHTRTIATAPAETLINGGAFRVPPALGSKIIHPFSDFLLHDVGTGDGIVENGGQTTRNKVRTAPLWGLRLRSRLMHDGLSVTVTEAILRHGNQAEESSDAFLALSATQRIQLLVFLSSL
jgi:CxxC motif-containing protein (DUF1111 family)